MQVSPVDNGLEIEYPKFDYYAVNQEIEFEFHVYNSSNYWITNSTIRYCNMHIYDNLGTHFLKQNATYQLDSGDWEIKTTLTKEGTYSYIFYCEGTREYGYVSSGFIVNKNATNYEVYGTIIEGSEKNATIGFTILYVGLMILFVYLGFTFYAEKNMMFFFSFVFWYIGLIMPLIALRMFANLSYLTTNIKSLIETTYIVYLVFYGAMVLFIIIYFMVLIMEWLKWDKKPDWMKRTDI